MTPSVSLPAGGIIDPARLENIRFSNDEIARYSRHLIMPEVTMEGQKRLKASRVLCIGTGGLGSPIALYLAAAGVGRIGLGGLRRGGLFQPPASDPARHGGRGPQEAEVREGQAPGHQSQRADRPARCVLHQRKRAPDRRAVRHRHRRDGQLSRLVICRTTSAFSRRSRTSTARSSASRVSARCSPRISGGLAIVACSRNHRRRAWCRVARRAACWACCRGSSA